MKENNQTQPYTCPICLGRGCVPPGFYNLYTYGSTSVTMEICRTCNGTGIVWAPGGFVSLFVTEKDIGSQTKASDRKE